MNDARAAWSSADLCALIIVALAGGAFIQTLPVVLGAVADAYGYTNRQIGLLGSVEFGAMTVGSLLLATVAAVRGRRSLMVATAVLIGGNLACTYPLQYEQWLLCRLLTGLSAGVLWGYGFRRAGMAPNADRAIALVFAAQLAFSVAGLQVFPRLAAAFGVSSIFYCLAVLALCGGLAARLRWRAPVAQAQAGPRSSFALPPKWACIALVGVAFSYIAEGALWTFLERVGVGSGYSPVSVGSVLAALPLAGVAGSLAVSTIPAHFSRPLIIGCGLVCTYVALLLVFNSTTIVAYGSGCGVLGLYSAVVMPLVFGIVSRVDPTARSSALFAPIALGGGGIGAGVGGLVLQGASFTPLAWLAAALYTLAVGLCIWVAVSVSGRRVGREAPLACQPTESS